MAKKHSPRFLAIVNAVRDEIQECEASDLPELISTGAVLIDVREQHEFEAGHHVDAIHLGKGVIERDIEKQDFDINQKLSYIVEGVFAAPLLQSH